MQDLSLHSPVPSGSAPVGPSELGQYSYEDDEESGAFTPRRVWPADYARPHRYAVRALPVHEAQRVSPVSAPRPATATAVALLTVIGLSIFVCSVASLVVVTLTMDVIDAASKRILQLEGVVRALTGAVLHNGTRVDRALSLVQLAWSLATNLTQA